LAQSDSAADFYRGKTIHVVIGYGAGGGYDLYGRLIAEFLGRHIPGNPAIVAQNMPGAGSFNAAQYLYNVAPRDGTYLGSVSQTLPVDAATGELKGVDATKFHYLGRLTSSIELGVAKLSLGIKSFDDVRQHVYAVGTTGGSSPAALLPTALNAYGGAKFKLVKGYQGAADLLLALERNEIDIVGATSLPNLLVKHPDWILKQQATILYQNALKRNPLLPDTPTVPELGVTEDGRAILRVIASTAEVGRSIIMTPGVPEDRVKVLRDAFQEMLKDPDFLAAVKARNLEFDPGTGQDMDAISEASKQIPARILEAFKKLTSS
jgi:tripartite-type tricarboxylate transporter receptor subunit TctC